MEYQQIVKFTANPLYYYTMVRMKQGPTTVECTLRLISGHLMLRSVLHLIPILRSGERCDKHTWNWILTNKNFDNFTIPV